MQSDITGRTLKTTIPGKGQQQKAPKNLIGKKVTVNVEIDLRPLPTTSSPIEVQLCDSEYE